MKFAAVSLVSSFLIYSHLTSKQVNLEFLPTVEPECLRGIGCEIHCDSICSNSFYTGGACYGTEKICYCNGQICTQALCTQHCYQDQKFGMCIDKNTCRCNKTLFDLAKMALPEDEYYSRSDSECIPLFTLNPNCIKGEFCRDHCDDACDNLMYPGKIKGQCIGEENECHCSDEECSLELCNDYCSRELPQGTCQNSKKCVCSEALYQLTGAAVPSPKTFERSDIECHNI